jgi:hypothetical protein
MAISLEKTVWTYKHVNDQDMINENIEIIVNFFERFKYEINVSKYYGSL